MSRRFFLSSVHPGALPPTVLLGHGRQLVGRSSACHVALKDLSVSRRHAELFVADSAVTVTDLDSRNGTFVEGKRILTCQVTGGQRIRFGKVAFFLVAGDAVGGEVDSEVETDRRENAAGGERNGGPAAGLSPAQRRVLDLLVEGLAEKQIATRLHLSHHTVHNHVRAIYGAYSVHSRSELLALLLPGQGGGPRPPA